MKIKMREKKRKTIKKCNQRIPEEQWDNLPDVITVKKIRKLIAKEKIRIGKRFLR